MYFQSIAATTLALLTLASTAPLDQSQTLSRRGDTCTITGFEANEQDVSYGIGSTGTSASGSLTVSCTNGKKWNNNNQMPNSQRIKSSDSGLPEDIQWNQVWRTGGYVSCAASYRGGALVDGKIGNDIQPGVGTTSSSSTCAVTFDI